MITADFDQYSNRQFNLTSTNHKKSATLINWGDCWQIKYDHNGARKNVQSYNAAIKHLEKAGW